NDHCHRVPPYVVADLLLEVEVSREPNLLLHGNRVDVRGVRRERQIGARASRFVDQRLDQELRALRALIREDATERVEPFPRFLRIVIGVVIHGRSPAAATERGHVLACREFDCMRRRFRPHTTAMQSRVDSILFLEMVSISMVRGSLRRTAPSCEKSQATTEARAPIDKKSNAV